MTDLPPPRPLYLELSTDSAFGVYHAPPPGPVATAVLLCPPWGWDDVSSYRSRLVWAEDLAAAGHPTLRIDLPGTGDSAGSAADPDRIGAASAAVTAAASWLRTTSGADRVAVVGLGLGGLVAARALADGAPIDELVLWAVPATGRNFIRQQRAFANMQGSRYSLSGESEPAGLPTGWMEVNGFVLSADTIAAIEAIRIVDLPAPGLQRALLLEQDGLVVDPDLHRHLADEGVEVSVRPGAGWGAMTFHPEQPSPPRAVFDTVRAWLAEPSARVVSPRAPSTSTVPAVVSELDLSIDGVAVRETPLFVDGPSGRGCGILTRPTAGSSQPVGAIFLNAGAVRRIGPNRIWVDTARRWAARGIATLRIDLEGIGDSDGDGSRYRDVGEFFRPELGDQIGQFIEAFVARGHGPRILVAGLCAGGYWGFHIAARDERVTAALLLNPGLLEWHPDLLASRDAARLRRLREVAWWRRILRGQVRAACIRAIAGAAFLRLRRRLMRLPRRVTGRGRLDARLDLSPETILDGLRTSDTTVLMAFSADEALHAELARAGLFSQPDRWPNMRLESLVGRDHTLRPVSAQRSAAALLDRELDRELARATAATTSHEARSA